jgi:hypothetical protein
MGHDRADHAQATLVDHGARDGNLGDVEKAPSVVAMKRRARS